MICIVILLFSCVLAAQPKYEVRIGYTRYEQLPFNHSHSAGGFVSGVVLDFETSKKFSFQPGLLFVTKGSKPILYIDNFEIVERASYLEVPLMLSWKYPIETSGLYFDWGVGLYCAYGLGGMIKEKEKDGFGIFISEYSAFTYNKRFDTGLQSGIGVGGSRFHLGVEGQIGIINRAKHTGYSSKPFTGLRFFYGYKF